MDLRCLVERCGEKGFVDGNHGCRFITIRLGQLLDGLLSGPIEIAIVFQRRRVARHVQGLIPMA